VSQLAKQIIKWEEDSEEKKDVQMKGNDLSFLVFFQGLNKRNAPMSSWKKNSGERIALNPQSYLTLGL